MYTISLYTARDPPAYTSHLINLIKYNPITFNIGDITMAININQLWSEKTERLSNRIRGLARGNDDLYQEGLLGVRDGLLRNPYATDDQLVREASWAMSHYRNRGVSIDNGPRWEYTRTLADGTIKKYKKEIIPVYIDAVMEEFDLEFPDISYPPDILAMDRVCAERFYSSLDRKESKFIDACIKTMSNYFYNSYARRKLKISKNEYKRIKHSTYQKFIQAFGTDDDIFDVKDHYSTSDSAMHDHNHD